MPLPFPEFILVFGAICSLTDIRVFGEVIDLIVFRPGLISPPFVLGVKFLNVLRNEPSFSPCSYTNLLREFGLGNMTVALAGYN